LFIMLRSTTDPVNPTRTVFNAGKLLENLECRADVFEKKAEELAKEKRYDIATRLQLRAEVLRGQADRINEGEYDVNEVPVLSRPALDKEETLNLLEKAQQCGHMASILFERSDNAAATFRTHLKEIIMAVRDGDLDEKSPDPARSAALLGPALDKGALLKTLKIWADAIGASSDNERKGYRHVVEAIESGAFDLPATEKACTKTKSGETCTPAKPALDKDAIIDQLRIVGSIARKGTAMDALGSIGRLIERATNGIYDLPATPISTADLVEQLRSRESLADGIDITDLRAYEMMTIGHNKPMTVIAVVRGAS
jgi:hypothetical protein